jgi:hypothetical protein
MLGSARRSILVAIAIVLLAAPAACADNVQLSVYSSGVGAALNLAPTGRELGCEGARCSYEYPRFATVTVTARPKAPTRFARWLGACSDSARACRVVLDESKAVTARFSPVALTTGRFSSFVGGVFVNPAGRPLCGLGCQLYPYATEVTVTARPAGGRAFRGWTGPPCSDSSASDTCVVTMYDNVDAVPRFECTGSGEEDCVDQASDPIERMVQVTITVRGSGTVLFGGERCSGTCRQKIERGRVISLLASPTGSSFGSWTGACRGASPRCQMAAFRDARGRPPSVIARFR